jgi:hypothetical protein
MTLSKITSDMGSDPLSYESIRLCMAKLNDIEMREPKLITCPECDGEGRFDYEHLGWAPCDRCDESGLIEKKTP